jgi:hypothetical protein
MAKFSSFVFSATPPIKLKLELAYTWGITNSKPSGPIIMIDQLEVLSLSQVQFITLIF